MQLYIQNDSKGIVFWFNDTSDDVGPHYPYSNASKLESIDHLASQRIREFLNVAEENKWSAYGLEDKFFASVIGVCLKKIQDTMPDAFDEEAVFVCPQPLAEALSIAVEPIPINDWIEKYPASTKN